ncbi:D-alanine--poly(phosphoribitol) ligase subunit DltC [Olsenella profusa]|nr:D-alanine--poly(phosphoribitol) ligase subunit DltC [Olsenella profusa]
MARKNGAGRDDMVRGGAAGASGAGEKDVEARVLDLLEDVCGDPAVRDHLDDDLFELGLLDSMAAIELLVGIEDEFGVSIAPTEVPRAEMNTPHKIAAQVARRVA